MSQGANFLPTTGVYSGLTATNDLNAALDAMLTDNSGSSAPTNALGGVPKLGQRWIDTTSATFPIVKRYTGSAWVVEAVIDVSGGTWLPVVGGGIGTIASATTTDLGTQPQSVLNVTGTTTITGLGSSAAIGSRHLMIFGGILTLTYDATALIIPGGSSITTAAGDVAEAIYLGSGHWRILNYIPIVGVSVLTSVRVKPQGYLTLTTGTPIIAADVISATSVFYTPYDGNLIQIYNGTAFVLTAFSELTLALVASHTLSTIYDVFVINDSGVIRLVTGPAWSNSAAGTGAGTTELQRLNGLWTNKVSMTARYGATTTTVAVNQGTYVGSIFIDGVAGQVTCHRSYGQSRKWGVWNAYNRAPIVLLAGDATASWNYATNTIRAANASSANSLTVFCGLPEEIQKFEYAIYVAFSFGSSQTLLPQCLVGFNSTTVGSGRYGRFALATDSSGGNVLGGMPISDYIAPPALGINVVTALESGGASSFATWNGGNQNMQLKGEWRA